MKNAALKHDLQVRYGKGCMFKNAGIEKLIERLGKIKTYKVYVQETRYKRRKIHTLETSLTYHHLRHRSEGGHTTMDNGAVLSEMAHRYIHSLPRDEEELINDMIRKYKFKLDGGLLIPTSSGIEMSQPISIELDFSDLDDCIEIGVFDTTEEDKIKFNRAKQKKETKKLIEDSLYGDDYDDR